MYKRIADPVKREIINKIRNEGTSVQSASETFEVSTKAIYTWLRAGISPTSVSLLEHNRLKRENAELYEIIGRLTTQQKKGKKRGG